MTKLAGAKRVPMTVKVRKDRHRRKTFNKAVNGNGDGVAIKVLDLICVDGGGNGSRNQGRVDVRRRRKSAPAPPVRQISDKLCPLRQVMYDGGAHDERKSKTKRGAAW